MSNRYPVTRLPLSGVGIDTLINFLHQQIDKENKRLGQLEKKSARRTKRSPASSRYPITRIDEGDERKVSRWKLGSKKKKSKRTKKSNKTKKSKKTKKSRGKKKSKRTKKSLKRRA